MLAVLLATAALPVAGAVDAAPGDVLKAARTERPGSSAALPRHPSAAIRLLTGAGRLPTDDLTPILVQALRSPELLDGASRRALEILLAPPAIPGKRLLGRGDLRVHFSLEESHGASPGLDAAGVPSWAGAALQGLKAAELEASALGLRTPLSRSPAPFDLYLVSLGGGVAGYAVPRAPDAESAGYAVLDPSAFRDAGAVAVFAARLYGRAVGFGYRPLAPAWWTEPAALWLEERALPGEASRYTDQIARRRQSPELSLRIGELGRTRGGLDLLRTLDAGGDGRRVRAVWEAAEASPALTLLDALDLAARGDRQPGAGLDRLVADLAVRAASEGDRGEGPPLRPAGVHDAYPLAAIETAPAVEPLGTSMVVLRADDEDGGLRLRFEGTEGGRWAADLLLRRRDGSGYVRSELVLDGAGRGEIGLPWADYDQALMLVRNMASSGHAALFTYTAAPEARYPYSLTSFDVTVDDGVRRLTWETAQERDLFGWMVYRRTSAGDAWQAVTHWPLPALGSDDGPALYQMVDDESLAEGTVAHYRVVGVTRDGLTRTADAAAARP